MRRATDLAGAIVCLVLLFPLIVIIAIVIRLDSRGPILHRQHRLGRNGVPFPMLKFRTMYVEADDLLAKRLQGDPAARFSWECFQKLYNDPRITPVGRVLRRWSLDELPQLWNVLKGQMSLIGPRPILPEQRAMYGYGFKYTAGVRPGLTGLWQVSGRNRLSFQDRVRLDRLYLDRRTLWLDAQILLRSVPVVIRGDDAY